MTESHRTGRHRQPENDETDAERTQRHRPIEQVVDQFLVEWPPIDPDRP